MMSRTAIRVVLADDHSVVRRGIREFLTEAGDIQVVGEADSGVQALELIDQRHPDVAVLDVQMPGGGGIEVARRVREKGLGLGILILTAYDDPPYIRAAIDAGANGYVLKSSEAEEIVDAVRAVCEGRDVLDARLPVSPSELTEAMLAAQLTERERDVLSLAARGLTNKAIGFQLSISDRTVQGHLANIYEKLGAASRTEAVTRAAALKLIDAPHF
ncbi:MAG: response regulator transcription factor [Anaerolineae bacterium]|nr:response regulator transcription factor [Anaerolineae bacterium]